MARSRGQLRKRGRNKYLVRIYLGRVDGKRKYKSTVVHGTEKEAEKVLTKMLRKKDRGIRVSSSSEKLDEFLDAWLDTKRGKIAASTLKFSKNNIRIHIKPGLGHLKLESLTPRIVQEFIDELCTKDLSAAYIQKIQGTLRTALNQAVNWEFNPKRR